MAAQPAQPAAVSCCLLAHRLTLRCARCVARLQWEAIPDIGDYTVKKQKVDKFTPVPDSLLAGAAVSAALWLPKTWDVHRRLRCAGQGIKQRAWG